MKRKYEFKKKIIYSEKSDWNCQLYIFLPLK